MDTASHKLRLNADPGYAALKSHVVEATGLAYYEDHDDAFAREIAARMAQTGDVSVSDYLHRLRHGSDAENEMDQLVTRLTIGETSFFRHRALFDAMRDRVIPDVIRRNHSVRRLRVWSAGCSTGAEPYSVSILLAEHFAEALTGWDVQIIATDINRSFLAQAREGLFERWAFRECDDALRDRCFDREGQRWRIHSRYQQRVRFQCHNLVRHTIPSFTNGLFAFDVIMCRNVVIYFREQLTSRLIGCMRDSLVDGGWLLVGHAEPNIQMFRSFETVNEPGAVLYRKSTVAEALAARPGSSSASEAQPDVPAWCAPWTPPAMVQPVNPALLAPSAPDEPRATTAGIVAPAVSDHLAAVRRMADLGQLELAAERCSQLIRPGKPLPRVLLYHGMLCEQLGRDSAAEDSMRRAIAAGESTGIGWYYLGQLLHKGRRSHEAADAYRRAIAALATIPSDTLVDGNDELTAGDLIELAQMQIELLGKA